MSGFRVTKDPQADLDYTIDWTAWLGTDTIDASTWAVPAGSAIEKHNDGVDATKRKTTVWLRGGTVSSAIHVVTNHIVTAAGRAEDRSLWVIVQER